MQDGPPQRKLPISRVDLFTMRDFSDSCIVVGALLFCVILSGGTLCAARVHTSARTIDVAPYYGSQRTQWGYKIDSISHHINGGASGWLNFGADTPHRKLPENNPYGRICLVSYFEDIYQLFPDGIGGEAQKPFARRRYDFLLTDPQVAKMLKTAVRMGGMGPCLYTLRALRRGGADVLYMSPGDLDLFSMYGRWKGNIAHVYSWGSHIMLQGVANLTTAKEGPIIHLAAGSLGNPLGRSHQEGIRGLRNVNRSNPISILHRR